MRPLPSLKRVDPDEAVVHPGGLDLGRQVQFTVSLVHRQEPVHFRTHLLGRTVFVHRPVGAFRVVRPDLVVSSAERDLDPRAPRRDSRAVS